MAFAISGGDDVRPCVLVFKGSDEQDDWDVFIQVVF